MRTENKDLFELLGCPSDAPAPQIPQDHVGRSWEEGGQEKKPGKEIPNNSRSRFFPNKKPLQALGSGRGQGQHLLLWSCRKRRDFPAHSLPRSGRGERRGRGGSGAAGMGKAFPGWGKAFLGSAGSAPAPNPIPDGIPMISGVFSSLRFFLWAGDNPKNLLPGEWGGEGGSCFPNPGIGVPRAPMGAEPRVGGDRGTLPIHSPATSLPGRFPE